MEVPQHRLNRIYKIEERFNQNSEFKHSIKKLTRKCLIELKRKKFYKRFLYNHFPTIDWITKYKLKSYLTADILAGLIVGIMNIPQVFNIFHCLVEFFAQILNKKTKRVWHMLRWLIFHLLLVFTFHFFP